MDVLQAGPDRAPGAWSTALGRDGRRVGAAAAAVLAAAVLALPSVRATPQAAPVAGPEPLRVLPRVLLTGARVAAASPVEDAALAADGVLALDLRIDGLPSTGLLSLRLELPGTAVVVGAVPPALSPQGSAQVEVDVLPTCPGAVAGLARGAVVAVVRGPRGSRVRQTRVRLDPGPLAAAVVARCGTADGLAPATVVPAPGPAGAVGARVPLLALGRAVRVVAVLPGPGLAVTPAVALPLDVRPGASVALDVALRAKGCGGAPDTPPFVLRLDTGETVAPSVDPALRPALDRLRPYRCTAP